MRYRIITVLVALITVLVVYNLIKITIGMYTGEVPVRGDLPATEPTTSVSGTYSDL